MGFLPRAYTDLGPFLVLIAYERWVCYHEGGASLGSNTECDRRRSRHSLLQSFFSPRRDGLPSSATIRSSVLYTLENTEGRCTIFTIVLILPHDAAAYEYDYLLYGLINVHCTPATPLQFASLRLIPHLNLSESPVFVLTGIQLTRVRNVEPS